MDKIPNYVLNDAKNKDMPITVRIGHDGLSASIVTELKNQLTSRYMIKLKINKGVINNSEERKKLLILLEKESNSILVFSRGNTAVYWSGK